MRAIYLLFLFITTFLGFSCANPVVLFVSNEGSDANDGASFNTPMKTIAAALKKGPEEIRLRCGDIFYENIESTGISFSSYGQGEKPNICGLKILKKNAWERGAFIRGKWQESQTGNIWRSCLSLPDSCYTGYKTNGSSLFNNVGQIVDIQTNSLNNCRRVRFSNDLQENYDFWLNSNDSVNLKPTDYGKSGSEKNHPAKIKSEDFDFIYVYYNGNLNEKNIGLAVYCTGIRLKNASLYNIKVSHWGRCGIAAKSNTFIRNCLVDAIGGSYFINFPTWLSYGNGIEYYVQSPKTENGLVQDCIISRCYDCGLTIQGGSDSNPTSNLSAFDITFERNLIQNCGQSLEFFLNGLNENDIFNNCIVRNNLSLDAGVNTGFRVYGKRYKYCHILETSYRRKTGIIYENNMFINGNYYCAAKVHGKYDSPIWRTNTCYILRGQDLIGNATGSADIISIPSLKNNKDSISFETNNAIKEYRMLTNDQGTQFYIINDLLAMDSLVNLHKLRYYRDHGKR